MLMGLYMAISETCPFCGGEGVLIHSKLDDGYIYSEGVHAFVKCKVCEACGPMPDDAELVVSNYTIGFVATDVEYNELWNQIILSSE